MRWDGYVRVRVSKLDLPGDIGRRMKDAHVIALAESTDELGGEPMHAPSVNADVTPWQLVAGRDRMAATLLRKRKTVWVHVGKNWTDHDLLKAEIHENLHRRHDDKAALTKRLVDKAEQIVNAALPYDDGVSGHASDNPEANGRPKTARTKAREMVAEESGESVEAVRKRDERAAAKETQTAPLPPPIDTHGRAFSEGYAVRARIVQDALDGVDKAARKALAALTELDVLNDQKWNPAKLQRLRRMAQELGAEARAARPAHACPACADSEDVKASGSGVRCKLCGDERTITDEQWDALPAEQRIARTPGEAMRQARAERPRKEISVNGKPLSDWEADGGGQ